MNNNIFFFYYCGIQDFRDELKVGNEPEVIKVVGPGFFFLRTWVIEAVLMGKGTVAVLREELLASLGYSAGR